jgi:hypothetical protein
MGLQNLLDAITQMLTAFCVLACVRSSYCTFVILRYMGGMVLVWISCWAFEGILLEFVDSSTTGRCVSTGGFDRVRDGVLYQDALIPSCGFEQERLAELVFSGVVVMQNAFVSICVDFQITVLRHAGQWHTSVCPICHKWIMNHTFFLLP